MGEYAVQFLDILVCLDSRGGSSAGKRSPSAVPPEATEFAECVAVRKKMLRCNTERHIGHAVTGSSHSLPWMKYDTSIIESSYKRVQGV